MSSYFLRIKKIKNGTPIRDVIQLDIIPGIIILAKIEAHAINNTPKREAIGARYLWSLLQNILKSVELPVL